MSDLDSLFDDIETVVSETLPPKKEGIDWEEIKDKTTLLFPEVIQTEEGRQTVYFEKDMDDVSIDELLKWAKTTCGLDVDVADSVVDSIPVKDRKSAIFTGTVAAMTLFKIQIDEEVLKDIEEEREKQEKE